MVTRTNRSLSVGTLAHASAGLLLVVLLAGVSVAAEPPSATPGGREFAWPRATSQCRPGCYWWWPASAVDQANLTWNLEQLHRAGMGGVHIIPIYGVKGQEHRTIEYLSPEWMAMLAHTVSEGKRLDLWVDMSTGTGWPFGGPDVSADDADAIASYRGGRLTTRIGRRVKRAAPGGQGNCVNPFSPTALTRYLARFDRALADYQGPMPRAQYHDSFEYAGNWSNDLMDAFRSRRGYDLGEHLPELFGRGRSDTVARIKSDYRQTLSELHQEFIEDWVQWVDQKGSLARNQAHGAPANLLDLYAAADIPETETFGTTVFQIPGVRYDPGTFCEGANSSPLVNRFASSAAHVSGRRLVASETCTWLRNHFTAALSQIKPEIDQLFTNGINHVIYHGCCYSPRDAAWPGWLFYASTEFNPRNAFWRDIGALNAYVARCQSVLQSGEPANDVLLYWPVFDIWHSPLGMSRMHNIHQTGWLTEQPCGKLAERLAARGYTFDYVSDRQLKTLRADAATLKAPGGHYRVVLVPRCGHMPLETWKTLTALASAGATILVHEALPADVPGYGRLDARRAQLRDALQQLSFSQAAGSTIRQARVGHGRVLLGDDVEALLAAAGVRREQVADLGVRFARRTHAGGYHYFLANLADQNVDGWVPIGTPCESAVLMNPDTGATGLGKTRRRDESSEVYLQLAPGESVILRTFARSVKGPAWRYLEPSGEPLAVTGQWRVEFIDGGPGLPEPFTTSKLASWTTLGGPEAQRFAGTARYSIEFDAPDEPRDEWLLDLGDVRESARVRLNGHDLGAVWSVPLRRRVGQWLRPGKNRLEIEVTNLSANRIRDLDRRGVPWRIFHDINLVTHDYERFDASDWPVRPSGLVGPVVLRPMVEKQP